MSLAWLRDGCDCDTIVHNDQSTTTGGLGQELGFGGLGVHENVIANDATPAKASAGSIWKERADIDDLRMAKSVNVSSCCARVM